MKKIELNKNIGKYLKDKRVEANLTQYEVADKLGYSSPQFISNFERGLCSPPLKQLKKIIKLYSIRPCELIELIIEDQKEYLSKSLLTKKDKKHCS